MNTDSQKAEPSRKDARKEREREEHRRLIIREAEQVFGQNGYHGTTIEEIARRAGFSVGTLYNIFRNKDDLYASILVSHHEEITRAFDALFADNRSPIDTLSGLLDLLLAHFNSHRAFVRIFFAAVPDAGVVSQRPPEMDRFHNHYMEEIRGVFRRAVESGIYPGLDPHFLACCFEGFITGVIRYWAGGGFHEPIEALSAKAHATFSALYGKGTPGHAS